jgi:hypothetical protein
VNTPFRWVPALVVFSQLAFGGGCTNTAAITEQASTLKPLAVLYGKYRGEHAGNPPGSDAEFRAFVQTSGKPILDANQIPSVDVLFTSSRDNQPYVILYGPLTGPPGPGGEPVFAYEKVGVNGKRYVATSLGAVQEVDEAEFKRLVPGGS